MKEFWNERYKQDEYVYGEEANDHFKKELDKLEPKTVLLSAEGEGRNAVYAAQKGWSVTAFDISDAGKEKAYKLARKAGVDINYHVVSVMDIDYPDERFDVIGCFFMHLPKNVKQAYKKLISKLKPGGTFIFEAFSKEQINYNSGGPKNIDMLFSVIELEHIFDEFTSLEITEGKVLLNEGTFHLGEAVTIRISGIK